MRHVRTLCLRAILAAAASAAATGAAAEVPQASPYAGQESRPIKALSPQEVESLLGGKGMGFAKAAELNGYPGPAHVLELGDALALSEEQRERTRALFQAMEREAIALGRSLVEAERDLEALFSSRTATAEKLAAALVRTGELQARLRGVHLKAHIEQTEVLTPHQSMRYAELRGYGPQRVHPPGQAQQQHRHGQHH
ncbi:MAG: periplasmic heavy metal sensor [Burkholderiaceae bacterium]|nr:periplasmic heavy metal sensor [Burkholderiaceae bacterium]